MGYNHELDEMNYSHVSFKKNIDMKHLLVLARQCKIENVEISLENDVLILKSKEIETYIRKISARKLEWGTYANDYMFWMTEFIASCIIRHTDPKAKITNEGISEKMSPDFDMKYPTLMDWNNVFVKLINKYLK